MKSTKNPASVMNRIGANIIEMFIISLLYGMITALVSGNYKALLARFESSTGDYHIDITIVIILMAVYFVIVPLLWNGFTAGKFLLRTRVTKSNGENAGIKELIIRFFVLLLPNVILLGIPAIVNVYVIATRKDKKGYHDLLANTVVVSL
ncbi:RDD family protein [Bacillus sp. 165]|uniref:RDD family protein n=1 Tax=Bacillus sp. 165 TaxID=1529117 RepID=UPI001ADCEBEC|nr:RDD family protein [Bacillus sp. 165]MBO9130383.1 RDD family protein [Bacillus sp. 165]